MHSLVTATSFGLWWSILCLSDGSSASVHLPAPSSILNRAFHKKFRLSDDSKLNASIVDNRIFAAERASTMDSSQREFDNFSRAKSPLVAAFLTPLTASISAVRQSVETVSSGVRRCSDAARANPLFRLSRKSAGSEAEAALKTNPTQDAGTCARHVVRRHVSINARCDSIPCTSPRESQFQSPNGNPARYHRIPARHHRTAQSSPSIQTHQFPSDLPSRGLTRTIAATA